MPEIDLTALNAALPRVTLVGAIWATFVVGGTVRQALRATGRPVWAVRVLTIATWTIAIALAGRLFLVSSPIPAVRFVYQVLFVLPIPILFLLMATDRMNASIRARPARRVAMREEIARIHGELGGLRTAEDRERIAQALADLDRFIEPATFERIQLARSRVLSWIEGGPLAAEREARWWARLQELERQVRPASWQQGRVARASDVVGRTVHRFAPPLAVIGGVIVGRAVLTSNLWTAAPASLLLGYLLAYRWDASIVATLVGAAAGVAVALATRGPSSGPTIAGYLLVIVTLLALAALAWRGSRPRPPRLDVLPGGSAPRSPENPDDLGRRAS